MTNGTNDIKDVNKFLRDCVIGVSVGDTTVDPTNIEAREVEYVAIGKQCNGLHLFCGGSRLCATKSKLKFDYRCRTCGEVTTLTWYRRVLSKLVNGNLLGCRHCQQESDQDMKKYRSEMMSGKCRGTKYTSRSKTGQQLETPIDVYNTFSDDEKNEWKKRNFSDEEWINYSSYISTVNGHDIADVKFIQYARVPNGTKVANRVSIDGNVVPIRNITCKCSECGKDFNVHFDATSFKKRKSFLCGGCFFRTKFSNMTFPIKSTTNINGDKILYSSKYEFTFIKFCNENLIEIKNGPSLKYFWDGKTHKYYVDFFIPSTQTLIELKDNHKWHRDQLDNGKWSAKEESAMVAVNNKMFSEYVLLYFSQFTSEWKTNFLKKHKI